MTTKEYHPGDRVYYRNSFGQEFYATVVRVMPTLLIVQRAEWPHEEALDLDTYVRSFHLAPHFQPV